MFRTIFAVAVAVGLAAGSAAWAQTDESNAEASNGAVADDSSAADRGLSIGEPVEAELQVGDTYGIETFVDWELRCVRAAQGEDPCQLYQLLLDQTDNPVAEFTLFPLGAGGEAVAGGTIITPLETLLTAQLRIAVDGGQARRYPFSFCSAIGCFARIGLTQDDVDSFRAGSAGTVTINPAAAPDETVILRVSLSGFTAGYAALLERFTAQ